MNHFFEKNNKRYLSKWEKSRYFELLAILIDNTHFQKIKALRALRWVDSYCSPCELPEMYIIDFFFLLVLSYLWKLCTSTYSDTYYSLIKGWFKQKMLSLILSKPKWNRKLFVPLIFIIELELQGNQKLNQIQSLKPKYFGPNHSFKVPPVKSGGWLSSSMLLLW